MIAAAGYFPVVTGKSHGAGNSNVNASWTSEVGEQFEYMYRLFFFALEH